MKSTRSRPSSPTLREVDHTYWLGGEPIMGTGETFRRLHLFDPSRYAPGSAERGDRVHRHTAARDARKRTLPAILPTEQGYCDSWRLFQQQWCLTLLLVEAILWHPHLRVAGTIDRLGVLARRGFPKQLAVIDIKTGLVEDWHRLQMSIYYLLVDHWRQQPGRRRYRRLPLTLYTVYLRADGREPKVRCVEFDPVVTNLVAAAQVARSLQR